MNATATPAPAEARPTNAPAKSLLTQPGREKTALEAAWEIDALGEMALRIIAGNRELEYDQMLVIRGALVRISELAGIVMWAIGDEMTTTEHLQKLLHGISSLEGAH